MDSNPFQNTPLHTAAEQGDSDQVRFLLQNGTDPNVIQSLSRYRAEIGYNGFMYAFAEDTELEIRGSVANAVKAVR